jgi:ribosomal protein S18 acetylase RimI-like enzyme
VTSGARSIEFTATPEAVWAVLVAPGRRDWYYRLAPEGAFTPGAHIRWLDPAGATAEESEVLEIDAPRRLVLRTRFTFAPPFAAATPHTLTWEVAPAGDRSRVSLAWDGEGPAVALLEAEGEAPLKGLRLELDPVARAEVTRLEEVGPIEVRDVTPERVADYQNFFDHVAFRDYPAWEACYCMETHRTQSEAAWAARTAGDNRRDMSAMIAAGEVTALLAYDRDEPIGWCNYGETTRLSGVMRKLGLEAADHEGVGSVACFVISAQYRGHGVASKLLEAAVERLRARGLRAVEAYPGRDQESPQGNYRGPIEMYRRAGFEPYREHGAHVIMRKALS